MKMHAPRQSALRIWRAPMAIGALIAAGLAVALLAEGIFAEAAVCIALAIPVVVIAGAVLGRSSASDR